MRAVTWIGRFLRSLLFIVGQWGTVIMFAVVGQFTRLLSERARYRFMTQWSAFCIWWLKVICGVKYQFHGLENVDMSQPSLILCRHESAWETLAFQSVFPPQAYVLKRELLKIPFFGWGLKLLNPIAIDRSAGRKALNQLLSEGERRLHNGDWVVIFPEGTRMPPDQLGKINVGGGMLALKAKVPVYLITHNAGRFWPKNGFLKHPGKIDVWISEPLDVSEISLKELNQQMEQWFSKALLPAEEQA